MNDYKELLSRIAYCTNEESCDGCPLDSDNILYYCVDELLRKASDAIEQLCTDVERLTAETRAKEQYIAETIGKLARERERDDEIIASLQKELVEAAKERDAAIADLKDHGRNCKTCLHGGRGKNDCLDREEVPCNWEWRGVQEVEHE